MQRFRATIAAVVALALAALPVPALSMQAAMAAAGTEMPTAGGSTEMSGGGMDMAAHEDHCCPQAEHCDEPVKTGCDHTGACALKCASLSANVAAGPDMPALTAPRLQRTALAERLSAAPTLPQLPPPRL